MIVGFVSLELCGHYVGSQSNTRFMFESVLDELVGLLELCVARVDTELS